MAGVSSTTRLGCCRSGHQSLPLVRHPYIDGLVQDCGITIVNALEILQSCTKPSIYRWFGPKKRKSGVSLLAVELTYRNINNMTAILQTIFWNLFSWEKALYFDLNFTEICSLRPIDNKSSLVQVMVWHRIGDKRLPKGMMFNTQRVFMHLPNCLINTVLASELPPFSHTPSFSVFVLTNLKS